MCLAAAGSALLVAQWAGGSPFWLDEEMLALNLRGRSIAELAEPLWLAQTAPFGWLALERAVLLGAGASEQALRAVPLLFGLGTLATAGWIAARWLGAWGGGVLTLLCAFGPWLSYHAVELKPYSADAFWALLLPALAAWALEPGREGAPSAGRATRRVAAWWAVAAVSHWFGVGALLATPACAIVVHGVLWRRHGWRSAARAALPAFAWLASFGLHYAVSMRHALDSDFLQTYWRFALPPEGAGLADTFRWLGSRLHPLAVKPIGTSHSLLLWGLAAGGAAVAIGTRPAAGLLLIAVPISGFAWAALRLVPMFERLSLFMVPAVYVAVGVAAAGLARLTGRAFARRRFVAFAAALAGAAAVATVAADTSRRGAAFLTERPGRSHHDLDDRGAVRWLVEQARPGDVVLTTHLALPAVWWYANIAVPGTKAEGGGRALALPVFEAQPAEASAPCDPPLADQLGRPARVLVYLGFRFDDWPKGYDDVLFARLAEAGEIAAYRRFAGSGAAMVVDLRRPPSPGPPLPARPGARPAPEHPDRCVAAAPAAAW